MHFSTASSNDESEVSAGESSEKPPKTKFSKKTKQSAVDEHVM